MHVSRCRRMFRHILLHLSGQRLILLATSLTNTNTNININNESGRFNYVPKIALLYTEQVGVVTEMSNYQNLCTLPTSTCVAGWSLWRTLNSALTSMARSSSTRARSTRPPWLVWMTLSRMWFRSRFITWGGSASTQTRLMMETRTQEPGGAGGGGQLPLQLKMRRGTAPPTWTRDLPISLNDWYSIYLPRRNISAQVVTHKEHGSLMHWPVDCFQIDLFYFTDLFVWFQMIYMSSSLFKDNLVKKSETRDNLVTKLIFSQHNSTWFSVVEVWSFQMEVWVTSSYLEFRVLESHSAITVHIISGHP